MTEDNYAINQHALYWSQACETFMQRLVAYAMKLANGRSYDADDLVQETVLRALNCYKDPVEVANPLGYLLRIMRNIWITKWRDEGSARVESLDDLQNTQFMKNHPTVAPEVFRILENRELLEAIKVILRSLDPREKTLLTLYLKGYKSDEIGEILKEDVRITQYDLNAVRTKVRQRIRREGKPPEE